jgi:DNA-binding NarL/FixJ family response regulator
MLASAMGIRLVIAEDNYLVREGVTQLLAAAGEVDIVAVCQDLDGLTAAVEETRPDVVLTDIRMPPTNSDEGIRLAEQLRSSHPGCGVVVLSQYLDAEYALKLLGGGAAGRAYLLKERVSNLDQLLNAIKEVASGGSVIDPRVVEELIATRQRMAASPLRDLTVREREVLGHVAEGKNNAAIARALFLTEPSVEKHINSIFSKLGLSDEPEVHRRVKAVLLYLAEEQHRPS